MSASIKVVGHLSLVGLTMALLGCGGASQEQEVTLESVSYTHLTLPTILLV